MARRVWVVGWGPGTYVSHGLGMVRVILDRDDHDEAGTPLIREFELIEVHLTINDVKDAVDGHCYDCGEWHPELRATERCADCLHEAEEPDPPDDYYQPFDPFF